MNRYAMPKQGRTLFGKLIVQVLDRITEMPAPKVYVGLNDNDPVDASTVCCGTLVAVTDEDGCFSYQLPAGKWIVALSKDNWHEVWIPLDSSVELTVIRHPGDQIRSRHQP